MEKTWKRLQTEVNDLNAEDPSIVFISGLEVSFASPLQKFSFGTDEFRVGSRQKLSGQDIGKTPTSY